MKMFLCLVLVASITSLGCRSVGTAYLEMRHDIINKRHETHYRKMLAKHAAEGDLIGTWTVDVAQHQKKLGPPPIDGIAHRVNTHTVSLYSDLSYSYLRIVREYGTHMRHSSGTWIKEAPGQIALTPCDDEQKGRWFDTINLDGWTNLFVKADNELHQVDH